MSSTIDGQGPIAIYRGADLNSTANTDIAITVPNGTRKYVVRRIILTNCSANISGGSLQYGFFSAVAEGGEAIVSKGVNSATSLTAATKFIAPTVAQNDTMTESTIYMHIDVANGSAATCDVYVYADILP